MELLLHGRKLTLHLIPSPDRTSFSSPATGPLVLYASGDGGWFGAAVGMFHTLGQSGRPVVGFSSRSFMKIERAYAKPVTAARVVEDYGQILVRAREALNLSANAPVVLTGWSRGASLAVLVAASPHVDASVQGVVAIGLGREEALESESESDDDSDAGQGTDAAGGSGDRGIYALIPSIAPRRVAVIQASHDGYLRAALARQLFGGESDVKRFVEIDAHNHRFGGGEAAFAQKLLEVVAWVGGN